jgi:CheY-like chemotaxis protein
MDNIPKDLLRNWQIVVIDDEEDSLEVAEIILTAYGANLYTAMNGEDGLAVIRDIRPHLVISDLSMPVMDGWGLIYHLKKDTDLALIPVIALTAHAMKGDKERALQVGFHNYLTKPLTVETFMQDLVNLLVAIPELADYLNI